MPNWRGRQRDASRAWISLEPGDNAVLTVDPSKVELKAPVILTNYGDSPALDVWSDGFIAFSPPSTEDIIKRVADSDPPEGAGRTILFPDRPEGSLIEMDFLKERPEAGTVHVTLFAKYRIAGHKEWRHTALTFVAKPTDASTKMYGMVGNDLRLNYKDVGHIINVALDRLKGGLPIAS